MNFKLIPALALMIFATNAMAIRVSLCPNKFSFSADVMKVHNSSIYSKNPGWKEAQENLKSTSQISEVYTLVSKKNEACYYNDSSDNLAVLKTAEFRDPEVSGGIVYVDQLTVNFSLQDSQYVTYIPVKTYHLTGIYTYQKPFSVKVKAKVGPTTKKFNVDMGMIAVTLD